METIIEMLSRDLRVMVEVAKDYGLTKADIEKLLKAVK